ncbi:MAG TPA: hypothetical protein PKX87_00390 [Alphaproteobacteria bacterium]|nr:hypothetical protein [Alphaproteobacteria bacterium]
MSFILKIILGLTALVLLLGATFYLWMWWAWTPKHTPAPVTHVYRTLKEGSLVQKADGADIGFKISAGYAFSWTRLLFRPFLDPGRADFYSVYLLRPEFGFGSSGNNRTASEIVRTEGKPTPVDLKVAREGILSVIFDGPLQSGRKDFDIQVDRDFYNAENFSVVNGVASERQP